jgi:acyl carrier protein
VILKLEERLGIAIPLRALFENPAIGALTEDLDNG